jgi:phosphohistidine swiveling domain-containing protein
MKSNEGAKKTDIIIRFKDALKGGEVEKWEGNFSLLLLGTGIGGCLPPFSKKYNFDFGYWIFCVEDKHGICFCDRSRYIDTTFSAYKKFIGKGDRIAEIVDFNKLWKKANGLYASNTPAALKNLAEAALESLIMQSFDTGRGLIGSTVFSESIDETQIKSYYHQIGGEEDYESFFRHATKPTFSSFTLRADQNILKNPHSPALQYIFCDYYLAPPMAQVSKKIEELISERGGLKKIRAEVDKIQNEINENKKAVDNFRLSLNKEQIILFDFAQTSMYIRDVRKDPLQKMLTVLSNAVREYFSRKGIPVEDAAYALYSDFIHGLYKSPEYSKEITKRKKQSVTVFFSNEEIIFEYGKAKEKARNLFDVMVKDSSSELSGNVAYRGSVKGTVKIILNESDFGKFKKGEILVASMTRPEYVPLMKKAIAIVTDEGGITCHAAIISRELKIPCIIGTKIATRALKDGDEVEVDANRGIVKIIKEQ